jgi:NAD(P)-dependent dehydrogenase (short-subunit alcohol dehydrogenase family)
MASTDINNLFSVKGRVALITGGTSGIGLMIAKV